MSETESYTRKPEALTWVGQVLRFAETRPTDIGITFGSSSVTWSALAERIRRAAAALAHRGVSHGDRVAVLTTNCVEHVEAVLGTQLLGAIAVPMNPRLAVDEVEFIVDNCSAAVIVVEKPLAHLTDPLVSAGTVERLIVDRGAPAPAPADIDADQNYDAALAAAVPFAGESTNDMNDIAFIMYTSGTTGRPKGSILTFGNLVASTFFYVHAVKLVYDNEVTLVTAPLFHTAGFGMLMPNLLLGYRSVILPSGNFSADTFLDIAEAEAVTNTWLLASQWQQICDSPTLAERNLRFRRISWGAAPATHANLRAMEAAFPNTEIYCFFGQTEMSPSTTSLLGKDSARKLGSVGTPLPHVSIRVVDAAMNDVQIGEVGEIVYRAPTATAGYWNAPDATAAAFDGGWFHSGDLVKQDDEGYVYVVDRLKDMIITGGENVYCAEVENVLADHPGVRDVAVVGAPDERWGETPVAFVVPADPTAPPTEDELIAHAKQHLASYKKPSRVVVVDLLPRNSAGKIVKPSLRARLSTR
ncbi:AMP-binding protein [Rhodococcus sp. CSLK01-03]|uniref:AMP-binding protein n=1 Tax=Rhodococcus indonesiensis TaxID=3055869 RepID=A0ABT7RP08_9NOCA|nr:AMP-binding protein [Rhodococcus indonesiensis]MDM7489342.1 AMP-binding protein [Rhodococcus indonesiensis]